MNTPILESTLTCPNCGFEKWEAVPTDACQFYYECGNCGVLVRPKAGDCCVFCEEGGLPQP